MQAKRPTGVGGGGKLKKKKMWSKREKKGLVPWAGEAPPLLDRRRVLRGKRLIDRVPILVERVKRVRWRLERSFGVERSRPHPQGQGRLWSGEKLQSGRRGDRGSRRQIPVPVGLGGPRKKRKRFPLPHDLGKDESGAEPSSKKFWEREAFERGGVWVAKSQNHARCPREPDHGMGRLGGFFRGKRTPGCEQGGG